MKNLAAATLILLCSAAAVAQSYTVNRYDADAPGAAINTDQQLVAPIGLARGIAGPWWVSDSGTAVSTLYGGNGGKRGLVVNLPSAPGSSSPPRATGLVFNFSATDNEFGGSAGSPSFLFATLEGTILGWPGADFFNAAVLVDRHGSASYTGMTIAEVGSAHVLYLADAVHEHIEAWDSGLSRIPLDDDAFKDDHLPDGLRPFNLQAVGADVVVTFAPRGRDRDESNRGCVAIFDARGRFLSRLERGPWLDAPWGVALAPHDFGELSHRLLIANHGNALSFGDGGIADFTVGPNSGPYNACYFTAAPQGGQHGSLGSLVPVPPEQTHDEPQSAGRSHGADTVRIPPARHRCRRCASLRRQYRTVELPGERHDRAIQREPRPYPDSHEGGRRCGRGQDVRHPRHLRSFAPDHADRR